MGGGVVPEAWLGAEHFLIESSLRLGVRLWWALQLSWKQLRATVFPELPFLTAKCPLLTRDTGKWGLRSYCGFPRPQASE